MQIPSRVRNIGDSNEASALNFKAMVGQLIGVFVMDSVSQVRISVRQRPPEIRNTSTYLYANSPAAGSGGMNQAF